MTSDTGSATGSEDRYHYSPRTGRTERCRAIKKCPLVKAFGNKAFHGSYDQVEVYAMEQERKRAENDNLTTTGATRSQKVYKSVPRHGHLTMPDEPTVRELVSSLRGNQKLTGYGVAGSFLFNLDTPDSDMDLYIIVEDGPGMNGANKYDKRGAVQKPKIKSSQLPNGDDVKIIPACLIKDEYQSCADILLSGNFKWADDSKWKHYVQNTRVNLLEKADSHVSSCRSNFSTAVKAMDRGEPVDRSLKFVKRAMKDYWQSYRIGQAAKNHQPYRPAFSEESRRRFYKDYARIESAMRKDQRAGLRTAAKYLDILES